MHNWNTDTNILKRNPGEYIVWKLEQLINFGLDEERLDSKLVKKYWDKLQIDPEKKEALAFLLWQKRS